MLTKKQNQLLKFIHEHLSEHGVSPSFDEMKEALGLKSKSGIHRLITALEERGFIRRLAHRARALEVIKMPDSATPEGRPVAVPPRPHMVTSNPVADGLTRRAAPQIGAIMPAPTETVSLPLYGRIAAGTPIEALRDTTNFVDIPSGMLGRGEHYALEVSGDSMVDAGILDGDIAVIERCQRVENGTIVVALVENEEATLKRMFQRGGAIALEAENPAYETRIYRPEQVRVQGRLAAILRQY